MTIARRVQVTGRVQGVFVRAWTRNQASELGVSGWVRNASDGSVEAHVQGSDAAVETLIDRLHRGPPSAQVKKVEAREIAAEKSDCFEIRH